MLLTSCLGRQATQDDRKRPVSARSLTHVLTHSIDPVLSKNWISLRRSRIVNSSDRVPGRVVRRLSACYADTMRPTLDPFRLLLICLAGYLNQQQQDVIDYLQEEN